MAGRGRFPGRCGSGTPSSIIIGRRATAGLPEVGLRPGVEGRRGGWFGETRPIGGAGRLRVAELTDRKSERRFYALTRFFPSEAYTFLERSAFFPNN